MPSEGFDDFPWPMASGRMMKYLFASSGWPGPNSSPAKAADNMLAPEPVVPCRINTGSPEGSPTVLKCRRNSDIASPVWNRKSRAIQSPSFGVG